MCRCANEYTKNTIFNDGGFVNFGHCHPFPMNFMRVEV